MKSVILAGGYGTRISEETGIRPKPMVEIGDRPILWHIMKIYSAHGINDFIICCGYKGHVIKEYFANYFLYMSDVTFDLRNNKMEVHQNGAEPWRVTVVDTGDGTMTGGRLKRVKDYIDYGTFCMSYGDGVSNVDIKRLINFHREQKTLATLTAVQPPGRFGTFTLKQEQTKISRFREKLREEGAWINGGFFVLEPAVIDYIEDDSTVWEREPIEKLAQEEFESQKQAIYSQCDRLLAQDTPHPEGLKLQQRYRRHREKLFVFLERPDVPFDNNGSERDLRNSVVHRKVTGGFRSDWAPKTFSTITTVVETAKKRNQGVFETLLAGIGRSLPADVPIPVARSPG